MKPGYSVQDGLICIAMTPSDWSTLLVLLGFGTATMLRTEDFSNLVEVLGLINRMNEGNPAFKPYDLQAPKGVIR